MCSTSPTSTCWAVAHKPSSRYPRLAGMSSKTAVKVREQLVEKQFIREHALESSARGGKTMLLELTPDGVRVLADHEAHLEKEKE